MGLSQSTPTDLSPADWSKEQCITKEPNKSIQIVQIRHNLFDLTGDAKGGGLIVDQDGQELCRVVPDTPKDLMHIVDAKTNEPLVTVYLPNMDQLMNLDLPSYHLYTYRANFEGQTPHPAHDHLHGYPQDAPLYPFAHFDRTQPGLLLGSATTHFCYSQIVAEKEDASLIDVGDNIKHVLCHVVLEDDEAGLLKVKVTDSNSKQRIASVVAVAGSEQQLMELHTAPGVDDLAMIVLTILGDHYWNIHKQHHPRRKRSLTR